MANTYYEITGVIDGKKEVLHGSFVKSDCAYELEAEKENFKADGYKNLKIESRETEDEPDLEIYEENIDELKENGNLKTHFFAVNCFGWGTGETKEEAIKQCIIAAGISNAKTTVNNAHKRGDHGMGLWTCEVLAPADTPYRINNFMPYGVETKEHEQHYLTYVTQKKFAYSTYTADDCHGAIVEFK